LGEQPKHHALVLLGTHHHLVIYAVEEPALEFRQFGDRHRQGLAEKLHQTANRFVVVDFVGDYCGYPEQPTDVLFSQAGAALHQTLEEETDGQIDQKRREEVDLHQLWTLNSEEMQSRLTELLIIIKVQLSFLKQTYPYFVERVSFPLFFLVFEEALKGKLIDVSLSKNAF